MIFAEKKFCIFFDGQLVLNKRLTRSSLYLLFRFVTFLLLASWLIQTAVFAQQPASSPPQKSENGDKNSRESEAKSSSAGLAGDDQGEENVSPYKPLRYDEDWSSLRDKFNRKDSLDRLKYIPLGGENAYLTIGGDIKPRYEYFKNEAWGAVRPPDDNGYLLQRYMLHFDIHAGNRFRAFVEVKSGIESGRASRPRPIDENYLDANQAFFDVGLGEKAKVQAASENGSLRQSETNFLIVRAGRQELSFGAGRLVTTREGTNVRLSFDALRGIVSFGKWRVDAFFAKPVEIDRSSFDDPQHETGFWGVYAVRSGVKFLPGKGSADVYYLGTDNKRARFDQGAAREIRHTFGARIWGTRKNWEYNHEFIFQTGKFGRGTILAGAVSYNIAYNFKKAPLKPRLGFNGDIISGDRDPLKSRLNTFNPLFPKNGYYGDTNLLTPANLIDLIPSAKFDLTNKLSATIETFLFWRQSLNDGVYLPGGMLAKTGRLSRARYVGTQPLVEMQYKLDRRTTLTAAYAHFAPGRFIRETPPGKAVNYFTAYLQFKF